LVRVKVNWEVRLAREQDIPALERLIPLSVRTLPAAHYSVEQMEAALGPVFGVDRQLIRDGTYFVVEQRGQIVGCGGWSRRKAVFGGDRDRPGEDARLDPKCDAARIRAFFVHPDFVLRGMGRSILVMCEAAIQKAGFLSAELVATLTGEPLYASFNYRIIERYEVPVSTGLTLPVVRMAKRFNSAQSVVMERLGKNHGGYRGETIDIRAVLREIEAAARTHGWTAEAFGRQGEFNLPALRRSPPPATRHPSRIYLSAGIHGDEPAGPLAALKLIQEDNWPGNVEIRLLPCLNPTGFTLNQRGNADGLDLNRDYLNAKSAEVLAHIAWLERQPRFDLYLCLHEDWESHGFYLYEQNPDGKPSLAGKIIEAVQKVCPIDRSEIIEDRPAQNGIIRPNLDLRARPQWPEAFYLIMHKSRQGYTLEAPSDFSLSTRVHALVAGVDAALLSFNPG
jgi:N-acetylglutamate synthase-like GNAT family acetyltransferase